LILEHLARSFIGKSLILVSLYFRFAGSNEVVMIGTKSLSRLRHNIFSSFLFLPLEVRAKRVGL